MQVLDHPHPATAASSLPTGEFIKAVKPSASARKAIADAQAAIENLMSIATATEPDRQGRFSALHRAADIAEQEFAANPTLANAEKLHHALVRNETAKISFSRINAVIHNSFPATNEATIPAAMEILDAAIAALDAEAEKAKASIGKNAGVFLDVASLDRQHQAAKADLEGHRPEIRRDAMGWLKTFGHA